MAEATPIYVVSRRVRRASVQVLESHGVLKLDLVDSLAEAYGFVTVGELVEALVELRGEPAARRFFEEFADFWDRLSGPAPIASYRDQIDDWKLRDLPDSDLVLVSVPDDWFIQALNAGHDVAVAEAFDLSGQPGGVSASIMGQLDRLFANNGVPYRYGDEGLERVGDPLEAMAVQEALGVLDDPRLSLAKRHVLQANSDLQDHKPEESIDESRHAVEAALLAVIADHNLAKPDKLQAQHEFNVLESNGKVQKHAEELVLAAPPFRGRTEAGHVGGPTVDDADGAACLAAAAGSIVYLASKLK